MVVPTKYKSYSLITYTISHIPYVDPYVLYHNDELMELLDGYCAFLQQYEPKIKFLGFQYHIITLFMARF